MNYPKASFVLSAALILASSLASAADSSTPGGGHATQMKKTSHAKKTAGTSTGYNAMSKTGATGVTSDHGSSSK